MNAQIRRKKENVETHYEAFRAALDERKDKISRTMDQCATHKGGDRGGGRRGVLIVTVYFGCVPKVSFREAGSLQTCIAWDGE